jgi:hypothetical protein
LEDRHKSDLLLVCCEQEKRADLAPSDESWLLLRVLYARNKFI